LINGQKHNDIAFNARWRGSLLAGIYIVRQKRNVALGRTQ